jgi:hypothetical protein
MPMEDVGQLQANLGSLGVFWERSQPVMVTRLHVRYTADKFPEDLQFREVDSDTFRMKMEEAQSLSPNGVLQVRYVIRHTNTFCLAGWRYTHTQQYTQAMSRTRENLARLTGWSREEMERRSRSRSG